MPRKKATTEEPKQPKTKKTKAIEPQNTEVKEVTSELKTTKDVLMSGVKKFKQQKASAEARERKRKIKKGEEMEMMEMDIEELYNGIDDGTIKMSEVSDDITAEEVVTKELGLWGINPDSVGFKVILSIVQDFSIEKLGHKPTYDEVIDNACKRFNAKKNAIVAALMQIVKRAKFEQSQYIPIFRKLPRDQITTEIVVSEFADFAE